MPTPYEIVGLVAIGLCFLRGCAIFAIVVIGVYVVLGTRRGLTKWNVERRIRAGETKRRRFVIDLCVGRNSVS